MTIGNMHFEKIDSKLRRLFKTLVTDNGLQFHIYDIIYTFKILRFSYFIFPNGSLNAEFFTPVYDFRAWSA